LASETEGNVPLDLALTPRADHRSVHTSDGDGPSFWCVDFDHGGTRDQMSTTALVIVLIVVIAVVLALVAALTVRHHRKTRLQEQFGPEYERTVRDAGSTTRAEKTLQARMESRHELEIHELSPAQRDRYAQQWRGVQQAFVDAPQASLARADALVGSVMSDCGYPMRDFDQQADLLSVDHPEVVNDYRQAHGVFLADAAERVSIEDARRAFIAYRSLFSELLEEDRAGSESDTRPTSKGDERV
jgi:hypothetical protein